MIICKSHFVCENALIDQKRRACKGLVGLLIQANGKLVEEQLWLVGVYVFAIVKLEDTPNQRTGWDRREK